MKVFIFELNRYHTETLPMYEHLLPTLLKIDNPDIKYLPLPYRFDQILALLREVIFDVLYYWEVGTDSNNYFLPF